MTVRKNRGESQINLFLFLFLFFFQFLFMKNYTVAARAIGEGLTLIGKTVIPSVFPFLILSGMLLSACRNTKHATGVLLLSCLFGVLFGTPIGIVFAVSAYEKGLLRKADIERIFPFLGLPSASFLIVGVGKMQGDTRFGGLLFLSLFLSAILSSLLFWRSGKEEEPSPRLVAQDTAKPIWTVFTDAVASAAPKMLLISAYVLFFRSVASISEYLLSALALPRSVSALLFGFFEISSAMESAVSLGGTASVLVSGFAAGWSGLSLLLQFFTVTEGYGFNRKKFLLEKGLQAILTPLTFFLLIQII